MPQAPRPPKAPPRPTAPPAPRLTFAPVRSARSMQADRTVVNPRGDIPAAPLAEVAPFVFWPDFKVMLRQLWRPGPPDWPNTNMAVVAKARSGKSTFIREIVPMRDRVVMFGTKMVDEPLYGPLIKEQGFVMRDAWDPSETEPAKVIFRPPLESPSPEAIARQREAFRVALIRLWQIGGWTVWWDEVRYLSETLKLSNELNLIWLQGGSMGITALGLTQRPVSVPLNMFEQSRFLVTFKISGRDDRKTMSDYAGDNAPYVFEISAQLEPRELLFCDTELDILCRTRVELPGRRS